MVASRNDISRVMQTAANEGSLMVNRQFALLVAIVAAMLVFIQNGLPLLWRKARTIGVLQASQTAMTIQKVSNTAVRRMVPTSLVRFMAFLVTFLPRLVVFKNLRHMFAVVSLFVALAAKSIDDLVVHCPTLVTRTFGQGLSVIGYVAVGAHAEANLPSHLAALLARAFRQFGRVHLIIAGSAETATNDSFQFLTGCAITFFPHLDLQKGAGPTLVRNVA